MCDLGGGCKIHLLWFLFFKRENSTHELIYVVDSGDRERVKGTGEQQQKLSYEDELKIVLILANKQDLTDAMTIEEISEQMKLPIILKRLQWNIMGCSAKTGYGLYQAIDWLVDRFNTK